MKGHIGLDGKYHEGKPDNSVNINPVDKSRNHEMQRREFARDILQPRLGQEPNPAFIKAYPDIAKEYFTQEQIDKAVRQI